MTIVLKIGGRTWKNRGWIIVLTVAAVLAKGAATTIETDVGADGAMSDDGLVVEHDIVEMRVAVVPEYRVFRTSVTWRDAVLVLLQMFQKVETKEKYILAFAHTIRKVVTE